MEGRAHHHLTVPFKNWEHPICWLLISPVIKAAIKLFGMLLDTGGDEEEKLATLRLFVALLIDFKAAVLKLASKLNVFLWIAEEAQ